VAYRKSMDTILVCIDESDTSDIVLTRAVEMAKVFNADLRVIHAVYGPAKVRGHVELPNETVGYAETVAQAGAVRARELGATRVSHHGTLGDIGPAICAAAERLDADLIVLGSRGHGRVLGAILGSTAQHVTAHAPCSVLVAR